mgnify:CR=1 FL=1
MSTRSNPQMRPARMQHLWIHTALPLVLLLAYAIASSRPGISNYLMPPIPKLLQTAGGLFASGELLSHILISLQRVFLGFFLSSAFALPLAISLANWPKLEPFFAGSLHFLRATPPLAMVPLLILWFGIGESSKLALIVLAAFFPVFLNTLSSLKQVDMGLLEMGDSLELRTQHRLLHIYLPEAMPGIITGLRLAFGYSWRALIGAEMIAASSGLGYLILDSQQMARIDKVYVGIFSIGMLGMILDAALSQLARRYFPSRQQETA